MNINDIVEHNNRILQHFEDRRRFYAEKAERELSEEIQEYMKKSSMYNIDGVDKSAEIPAPAASPVPQPAESTAEKQQGFIPPPTPKSVPLEKIPPVRTSVKLDDSAARVAAANRMVTQNGGIGV